MRVLFNIPRSVTSIRASLQAPEGGGGVRAVGAAAAVDRRGRGQQEAVGRGPGTPLRGTSMSYIAQNGIRKYNVGYYLPKNK